jgi:hypothetical protein
MQNTPSKTTWIVTALLGILAVFGVVFAHLNQQQIFPSINTTISMDNTAAVAKAANLDKKSPLGMGKNAKLAAAYLTDSSVNDYLSLEDTSNQLLNQSLKDKTIQTSFWSVRIFRPQTIQENYYFFAPNGSAYGFKIKLPESKELPNLGEKAARDLATNTLNNYRIQGIEPKDYILKDYAQERVKERLDHHFIYENNKKSIAEAKLEIRMTISGNQVTKMAPNVKLPENFTREFDNMRSFNNAFGQIGSAILIIGYGIIILVSMFTGWQKKALNWSETTAISLIIAAFGGLDGINTLPLAWYSGYDTAQTPEGFFARTILLITASMLTQFIQVFITLLAGEYLTRQTRPQLPQLWNWWHTKSAASQTTTHLIALGYVIFGLTVGYQAIFYIVAQKIPGVWIPTGPLVNPNIVSTYLPALSPFSISLNAGIWEELLFRAVPIGAALIIGKRYNCMWLALLLSVPLQAVIFGMAHASYPQQPFFIRTIELAIPFTFFGAIYLSYGLLPIITAHFLFDVNAFSSIIFNMDTPGIWIQQGLVIATLALPALIVLYAKITTGDWIGQALPSQFLNKQWKPTEQKKDNDMRKTISYVPTATYQLVIYCISSLLIATALGNLWTQFPTITKPLSINRTAAVEKAYEIARQQKLTPEKTWTISTIAALSEPETVLDYLIETLGKENATTFLQNPVIEVDGNSEDLSAYLPHYAWHTRYATFEGTQDDRAEELNIERGNATTDFDHRISENIVIPSISESEAIALARSHLSELSKSTKPFNIIKKQPTTTPKNRTDWQITFEMETDGAFAKLQPRIDISITGNQISGRQQYLHIPEKWIQTQKIKEQNSILIQISESILWTIVTLTILGFSLHHFVNSSINYRVLRNFSILLVLMYAAVYINNMNITFMQLYSAMDMTNQLISEVASWAISHFFKIAVICLLAHYVVTTQSHFKKAPSLLPSIINGAFLGCLLMGGRYLITQYSLPEADWQLGKLILVSGKIPWLGAVDISLQYLMITLFALAACLYTMTRKPSIYRYLFAIVMLTLVVKSVSFEHRVFITPEFLHLKVYGVIFLIICLCWKRIIRDDPLTIPALTATVLIIHLCMLNKNPVSPDYASVIGVSIAKIMIWATVILTLLHGNQKIQHNK